VAAKKYAASKGIVVEVLGLTFQKDRDIPLPAEIEHLPVLGNIISSEQSPNLHQSFPGPPSHGYQPLIPSCSDPTYELVTVYSHAADDSRSAGEQLVRLGVALGDGEKPLQTPMVADVFRAA